MNIAKFIYVFFISMVPVIELRGAIPIGLSPMWGDPLPVVPLYIVCILGNMIPMPLIYLFARKILIWGSEVKLPKWLKWVNSVFKFMLNKGEKAGKDITKKTGRSVYVALALFVGIPLPGTGGWTGALASSILGLDFKKSIISILIGIFLAGVIMGLVSSGIFSFVF